MAGLFDVLALLLTATLFVGAIIGVVWVVQQIQKSVADTKEALKKKGLHITDKGVSVKTDKRFDREDYIDAQQRGFIKTMGAASFGKVDENGNHIAGTTPSPSTASRPSFMNERKNSAASSKSTLGAGEEKKSRFGLRKK